MTGRLLLIWRLTRTDLRHRPAQTLLLLLAIAAGAATLTLGLALHGTLDNPYGRTRAATNGPDVVAKLFPTVRTVPVRRPPPAPAPPVPPGRPIPPRCSRFSRRPAW